MAKIKDRNELKGLIKELKKIENSTIRVGIIGDQELALIASVNEFGVKIPVTQKMRYYLMSQGLYLKKETNYVTIPERSFLRSTFDDKKAIKRSTDFGFDLLIEKKDAQKTLDAIGLKLVSEVQKKIRSNIAPGNHPFTTQQKGGKSNTLINEGIILQGITFEVK